VSRLGVVLSGGGARGAYQVGLLRFLARHLPDLRFPIVTGVSAGAINAAMLAGHTGRFVEAVAIMSERWSSLCSERVFDSSALKLFGGALRWGARLLSGGSHMAPVTRGLVDTSPLKQTIRECLETADNFIPGIDENIRQGRLEALGITTTNYATGQAVTWCRGRDVVPWKRPHRVSVSSAIGVDHVLASSALPLFFPAVHLDRDWHGDGGVRLTAPLSPALHLGADRILAVSTRYLRSQEEAGRPGTPGYPPPAQILGVLLNAVFLDMLDYDALQMERVNRLLWSAPASEHGDLRPVRLLVLRPSEDLGMLAGRYEARLPGPIKFMTRGLGTRETKSPDSLSLLMFQPDYLQHLMERGEQDAENRGDEILDFVRKDP